MERGRNGKREIITPRPVRSSHPTQQDIIGTSRAARRRVLIVCILRRETAKEITRQDEPPEGGIPS